MSDTVKKVKRVGHKQKHKQEVAKISEDQGTARLLLKGPFPDLTKLKVKELQSECQMWRNIWGWVPDEVKYYVARTGQTIGLTLRNYKRYLGLLLETHWNLEEIEVGVLDKVYDVVDGKHYYERKIVKLKIGSLIDTQWIAERTPEEEPTPPIEAEQQAYEDEERSEQKQDNNTITPS